MIPLEAPWTNDLIRSLDELLQAHAEAKPTNRRQKGQSVDVLITEAEATARAVRTKNKAAAARKRQGKSSSKGMR